MRQIIKITAVSNSEMKLDLFTQATSRCIKEAIIDCKNEEMGSFLPDKVSFDALHFNDDDLKISLNDYVLFSHKGVIHVGVVKEILSKHYIIETFKEKFTINSFALSFDNCEKMLL